MSYPDYVLYHAPGTRSGRTKMMLDLLGLVYGVQVINFAANEHKSSPYLGIHPFGQLPSLWYRGRVILDSGAQIMFLADLHHERGYSPPLDSPLRADYAELFMMSASLIEPIVVAYLQDPVDRPIQARLEKALRLLESRLQGPYFLGDRMSAIDVYLHWGLKFLPKDALSDHPQLREYVPRGNDVLNWTGY